METGNASTASENVLEKGEVEATKEGEKEKDKDEKEGSDSDKDKDGSNEQEVVFIQDMGFTVKIVSPGAEPFDIQVSSMELVQVRRNRLRRSPPLDNSFDLLIDQSQFFSGDPSIAHGSRGHVPSDVFLTAARGQHPGQLRRAEEHRGSQGGFGDQGSRGALHYARGSYPRATRARST